MYPKLLTLYGPFELNGYNTAIILGLGVFTYLTSTSQKVMSHRLFMNLIIESSLAGIMGGRVLHILSSMQDYPTLTSMLRIHDGGLSILGALIGVLSYSWYSLRKKHIPFFQVADCAAVYASLFHAIARVGCFLVGCCYGSSTTSCLSITYTHPQIMAPLGVPLHPSQLYSSALYLLLFGLLMLYQYKRPNSIPGTVTLFYLIGMSIERFSIDVIRGDRIAVSGSFLSFHQIVAIFFILGSTTLLLLRYRSAGAHEPL